MRKLISIYPRKQSEEESQITDITIYNGKFHQTTEFVRYAAQIYTGFVLKVPTDSLFFDNFIRTGKTVRVRRSVCGEKPFFLLAFKIFAAA